ncbi:MAG: VWA domain-containing protein [Planctomycetes bacterium]|nr:VWA domain-containing protein [Planctomycetota bacterium]
MTISRRLLGVLGVLGLLALVSSSRIWGGDPPASKQLPAARSQLQLQPAESALAESKFAHGAMVTYRTLKGDNLFALQVQPKLEAPATRRSRDYLVMISASAGQAGEPWIASQQIAKQLFEDAKKSKHDDQISIWVASTPAATRCLTNGFVSPQDAAGASKLVRALDELANKEWAGGTADLKHGIAQAIKSFDGAPKRQRILLFLGDGQSTHDPVTTLDRNNLNKDMVDARISLFSVPLGINLNPENLHGFATGTGGSVLRVKVGEEPFETAVERFHKAFDVPVMYGAKLTLPPEIIEAYPHQLPPLRSDAATLVVGRMKQAATIKYSVSGEVPGGAGQFIAVAEHKVPDPELDNYFLNSMFTQWARAKAQPAMIRADRALAFAFEQTRLYRQEQLLAAQIAIEKNELQAALALYADALRIDPNDAEAAAGTKVVSNLKSGKLTREMIQEAEKVSRKGQKIQKINGVVRWTATELTQIAKLEQDPKAGAGAGQPNRGDDLLQAHRDRMIIEEQKLSQIVDANLRQARKELSNDPDGALELLRVTLSRVTDHPDLSERVRGALLSRLETGLREASIQGRNIKQRKAEQTSIIVAIQEETNKEAQRRTFEQRVEAQFRVYKSLMWLARVEEKTKHDLIYALEGMAADARLKNQPIPVVAKAAYDQTLAGYNLRKQQDLKRLREERFLAVYLEVEKSHVPYPDEPGIYFPPLATWKAIRDIRKGQYEVSSLPDDPVGLKEAKQIEKYLSEKVEMKDFLNPMTLKEALGLLYEKFQAKNMELPILIDSAAFKEENPDAPDIYEASVKFQPFPKWMPAATFLRLALSQVPTNNATYLIRRNFIEITTNERQARQKVLRVYPVGDLVIPISQTGGQSNFFQGGGGFQGQIGFGGGGFGGQIGGQIGGFGGGFGGQIGGQIGGFGGQFGAGGFGGQFGAGGFGGQFGAGGFGGQLGQFGAGGFGGGNFGQFGAAGAGAFGFGSIGGFQGVPGSFQGGSFQGGFNGSLGALGASQAVSLISTITKVVAPGEWFVTQQPNPFQQNVFFPFGGGVGAGGQFGNMGGMFGMMGGGPPPVPVSEGGPADIREANTIEFFPPALALIVRGTSRIHTSLTGGIIGGKQKRVEGAWLDGGRGLDVIGGKGEIKVAGNGGGNNPKVLKNANQVVKIDPKAKPKEVLDPTKIWNEALAKEGVDPGVIVATADFLFEAGKFDHAAEFLKANLRKGIVVRPWVYEALAVALEASNGDKEEIRRARLSAVALDPKDAQGFLEAARTMAEHKQFDRALAFCRQAAQLEPNLAQPYTEALVYAGADFGKDAKAMEWAVGRLVSQDWPTDNLTLHTKAHDLLKDLTRTLAKENRQTEADRLNQALTQLKQRDLMVNLTWETPAGETADLELEVKEPAGSTCSSRQHQTPGGGTFLGTDLLHMTKASYIAAQAFVGDYEITVRRNWGQPLGNRARLEIIQNYGTAKEVKRLEIVRLDQKQSIKVHLASGRRTELATVPPPAQPKQAAKEQTTTNPLVRLRELAHPDFSGGAGPRGGAGTPNAVIPNSVIPTGPSTGAKAKEAPTYQSQMTSLNSSAMNMTAQVRLSGGNANLVLQPVFQTVGNGSRPAVNLPLIPGANP